MTAATSTSRIIDQLTPALAHSLMSYWWQAWEVQHIERHWYKPPPTARAYQARNRERPAKIWTEDDLELVGHCMSIMQRTDPAMVARLRDVHVLGAAQDDRYMRAISLFRDLWHAVGR